MHDRALTGNPEDNVPFWFASACQDPEWVKLLEWEALQYPKRKIIEQSKRARTVAHALKRIRQGQSRGHLSAELDPAQMLLTFRSLTYFPIAFPQITRMITGREFHDPQFQRDRMEFLTKFAQAFRPRPTEQTSLGTRIPIRTQIETAAGVHCRPRSKSAPRRTGIPT